MRTIKGQHERLNLKLIKEFARLDTILIYWISRDSYRRSPSLQGSEQFKHALCPSSIRVTPPLHPLALGPEPEPADKQRRRVLQRWRDRVGSVGKEPCCHILAYFCLEIHEHNSIMRLWVNSVESKFVSVLYMYLLLCMCVMIAWLTSLTHPFVTIKYLSIYMYY